MVLLKGLINGKGCIRHIHIQDTRAVDARALDARAEDARALDTRAAISQKVDTMAAKRKWHT